MADTDPLAGVKLDCQGQEAGMWELLLHLYSQECFCHRRMRSCWDLTFHPVTVCQVVAGFSIVERQALLKFATSCSRGPLGGFKHLVPPLCIHKVRLQKHQSDKLYRVSFLEYRFPNCESYVLIQCSSVKVPRRPSSVAFGQVSASQASA